MKESVILVLWKGNRIHSVVVAGWAVRRNFRGFGGGEFLLPDWDTNPKSIHASTMPYGKEYPI